MPVPWRSPGGAENAAAPLLECSLKLWQVTFPTIPCLQPCPWSWIHPGNRQGLPALPQSCQGSGGLCPCSGCPVDTRSGLARSRSSGLALHLPWERGSAWVQTQQVGTGLMLTCCRSRSPVPALPGSTGIAAAHPGQTPSLAPHGSSSQKCCFWHPASPEPEFLSCLQAG